MRFRILAAAGVLAGAALTGTMVPAQATTTGTQIASEWAMSIGGPIRSCAGVDCRAVYQTSYGEDVYVTGTAQSPAGNRWYKVSQPRSGYIYCANITLPC